MLRFGVTVDGQFLPKSVDELLQSHQFNKVPLITGVTDDDGGYTLPNVKEIFIFTSFCCKTLI